MNCSALRIREHGIQMRERARVMIDKPKCTSDGKNFGSVRLIDCYAALMALIYGIFATFLIFGVEILTMSKINKVFRMKFEMKNENIEDE